MRKTRLMLTLEAEHGQSIERLIADALTRHGSIERAAASLKVNAKTFYGWMIRLRITVKKVALVA